MGSNFRHASISSPQQTPFLSFLSSPPSVGQFEAGKPLEEGQPLGSIQNLLTGGKCISECLDPSASVVVGSPGGEADTF